MDKDFKKLYEAADATIKKQNLLLQKQEKYITELEKKNEKLSNTCKELYNNYNNVLKLCNDQQLLLDNLMDTK